MQSGMFNTHDCALLHHMQARIAQQVGASLEARVLLHVGDPALGAALKELDSRANGVDELRTLFIVSQVSTRQ